ncbi:NADPH-dependent FMN reductase [Pseudoruegeria sp. HB172150]|uniref:NADPH-dependent FMN reductase n=1 Tax=Pseudoruegeria sp. HB172150 TaxID=2721164 RepID=UPI0015524CD3|nr:NAD(P)H-dependent oxidoreductase [Pseudoruegeria sp. HB172150]
MALKLKIIIGSTRPGRVGPVFADWFAGLARESGKFDVTLVDLAELDLPLLDEPKHPITRDYQHPHSKRWSAIVDEADAYVFVTPEYDSFPPAALINAIQYLVHEWRRKPAGIVSYGGVSGGLRASQELRQILTTLSIMPLPQTVPVPFFPNFLDEGTVQPNDKMKEGATLLLNELAEWAEALKQMRQAA